MKTAAERLAAFTTDLAFEAIPPDIVEAAKLHLLDTLGCGLAAHALDVATAGRAAAAEMDGKPEATVIGLGRRLPAAQVALANAMLCHGLDFDDTHAEAVCHVSVVVGPAALAVGEARGAFGRDVVAALVGGGEIVARLGMAAAGAFHCDEPRMTQDVDILSSNAKALAAEIRDRLAKRFHLAIRVRELGRGRDYRVFQVRKPSNRHLAGVRNVEKLPPASVSGASSS